MTRNRFLRLTQCAHEVLVGIPLLLAVLGLLMLLVVLGTLAQATMPLYQAQALYFNAMLVWVGGFLPLPGVPVVLGVLAFTLLLRVLDDPLTWRKAPVFLSHVGVILLIVAGMANTMGSRMGYVVAAPDVPTRLWQKEPMDDATPPSAWPVLGTLPFTVILKKFERVDHPGTDIAASFSSELLVVPEGGTQGFKALISMNKPLRYEGYTLYQASYLEGESGKVSSVLAVVYDRSRLLPYLATGVLALGLLWRLGQKMLRRWLILFVMGVALVPSGWADAGLWDGLAVQHMGRLKPVTTLAGVVIPQILGYGVREGDAEKLLAEWMMTDAVVAGRVKLEIKSSALLAKLALKPSADGYTVPELVAALRPLAPALDQWEALPDKALTARQKEVLELVGRVENALAIPRTLVMVKPSIPLSPDVAGVVGLPAGLVSPWELLSRKEAMMAALVDKTTAKPLQQELVRVVALLKLLAPERPNGLLRIIPPAKGEVWLSPWMALREEGGVSGPQAQALKGWGLMAAAYPAVKSVGWLEGLRLVREAEAPFVPSFRLTLEEFVVAYPPLVWSLLPMGVGLLGFFWPQGRSAALMVGLGGGLLGLSAGLLSRMVILGRPPVATLYESVVFVAWVVLALGVLLGRKYPPARLGALGLGVLLTGVSFFLTQGNDTMGVLIAVLNTRFWLGVHVLTITAGYAFALLVGAGALACLVQVVLRGRGEAMERAQRWLSALILAAVLFTAVGTLLGGVWASESWGRFWGWDPKENGALVLTLWLIAVMHIRMMKPFPMLAWLGAAGLTPVVVALSWFGVNLLSVGLHSYGFITGVAGGLLGFCLGNVSLVGLLVLGAWRGRS